MSRRTHLRRPKSRKGAVVVLVAFLLIPLLGMVAFSVDYGYLLKVRTDLQRMADVASLAAVQSLIPAADGTQDLAAVRSVLRSYAASNAAASYHNLNSGTEITKLDSSTTFSKIATGFQVLDSDIEIGRFDPATIYAKVSLLNSGTLDTVRVTVRYDSTTNSPVRLFFARALGIDSAPVTATATAVLQKASTIPPGTAVLPFAMPVDVWDARAPGDTWSMYGDGKLTDEDGSTIPGGWGTVDIGLTNNSTMDLSAQILNGLSQTDLDALYEDGRIAQDTHIDGSVSAWMNGDTGLSAGIKSAVQAVHGTTRLVPIYDKISSPAMGEHIEFNIIGWGVIEVVDSNWGGEKDTWVNVRKAYMYDGDLRPHPDLSNTTDVIAAAYTSPALVE